MAQNGDAEAQFNLGGMYFNGRGVERNIHVAVGWLRMAAKQGHGQAQFNMGALEELSGDFISAYVFYSLASSTLSGEAKRAAVRASNKLVPLMSPDQLNQAKRIALAQEQVVTKPLFDDH